MGLEVNAGNANTIQEAFPHSNTEKLAAVAVKVRLQNIERGQE
jgi:hypothetical protein